MTYLVLIALLGYLYLVATQIEAGDRFKNRQGYTYVVCSQNKNLITIRRDTHDSNSVTLGKKEFKKEFYRA
jgi:hypothetical protein